MTTTTKPDRNLTTPDGQLLTVFNEQGRPFHVRIVRRGGSYGLNDCCENEHVDELVEFYDASQDPAKFGARGQFVARYFASTLFVRDERMGLDLYCSVDGWHLDGGAIDQVLRWLRANGVDGTKKRTVPSRGAMGRIGRRVG